MPVQMASDPPSAKTNTRHDIDEDGSSDGDVSTSTYRRQLEGVKLPFKQFPLIVEFMREHAEVCLGRDGRFRFLVLEGKTKLGKTHLGKSLYGEENTFYVNMQTCNEPDLRGWRYGRDKALLLDEISPEQVLAHKVMFQAGIDGVILGSSQCNQFAYWRFLYGVPIICCTNKWLPPERKKKRGDEQLVDDEPSGSRSRSGPSESSESEEVLYGASARPSLSRKDRYCCAAAHGE